MVPMDQLTTWSQFPLSTKKKKNFISYKLNDDSYLVQANGNRECKLRQDFVFGK
jgi:hypothetical protein